MYFAKVVGEVVAATKTELLKGQKLLLIEQVDEQGEPSGALRVAADTVCAGLDDLVACVGSREAALSLEDTFVPVDDAIIGIVDDAGLF